MGIESSLSLLARVFTVLVLLHICVCVCVLLIVNENRELHVMIMQRTVSSLPINNQVVFDVVSTSEVAFFFSLFLISCGM